MQIKGLATDLVYNSDKYVFFDDALKVIPTLKSKYKLAIVSDAWPSLKDVFNIYICCYLLEGDRRVFISLF